MRSRSLMTLLFFCFTALGLAGCGSTSGTSTEFVVTNPPPAVNVGALQFNFATAQQAFVVDGATTRVRFDFFENAGALGQPFVTTSADFAPQITISGLNTVIRSVRITGLDANRVPLYTITQAVTVVGGETTIVMPNADPVPVTLQSVNFIAANSVDGSVIDSVELEVGGTGQVYLLAIYSDGTVLVVGDAATYLNDPNDPDSTSVLEVGSFGQLRGLAPGQTNLIAQFAGQTFTMPVNVSTNLTVNFDSIFLSNEQPISVASGSSQTVRITGVGANGVLYGVSASSPNVAYSITGAPGITVSPEGVISVAQTTPGGATAVVTVVYTNANGTTVQTLADVLVSGPAGVQSISATTSTATLYSGLPVLASQITITETLTDNSTRPGVASNYTFTPSNPNVVSVTPEGAIVAEGAGSATVTIASVANPAITTQVSVTVESASVQSLTLEPVNATIPSTGSQTYTAQVLLSNNVLIDVSTISSYTLSNTNAFGVNGNVVSALNSPASGQSTTVTASFDPDGAAGPDTPVTANATLTIQ